MNNINEIRRKISKWDSYAELFKKINMNIDLRESHSECGWDCEVTDYYELRDEDQNLIFYDESLNIFLQKCKIYLKAKDMI